REKSGLVNFGLRFYDAKVGGFINPDPKGLADIPNPYAYMYNNPRSGCDVYGLEPEVFSQQYIGTGRESYDELLRKQSWRETDEILRQNNQNIEENWTHSNNYVPSLLDIPKDRAYFEFNRMDNRTHSFEVGEGDPPWGATVYVNGIQNSLECCKSNALYLSDTLGGTKVHAIYNPSYSHFRDGCNVIRDKCFRVSSNPSMELIQRYVYLQKKLKPDQLILTVPHSYGSLVTRNALRMCPKWITERVTVLGVAPAGSVDKKYCQSFENLFRDCDAVVYLDLFNMIRRCRHYTAVAPHESLIIRNIGDHSFQSPSYKNHLKTIPFKLNKEENK
ncbi:MAG: hypothetical protein P0S95_02870, partial [Rhabdochlamydiaceae bacterium]|nr:hypothetical protein [Candidatus Amphrikana amoebophyrae]